MKPLAALSGIYGVAGTFRNTLFDRGLLVSRTLEKPVVSVGNLSVGGSGKTPFVIALGELLHARGISFDVLSRGYRRRTRGVLVVEGDGDPADFGDEPLLIARRLRVPVIVGESRHAAGIIAEREFASRLHILDDGFQHRSLARDFDIVLLTERDFEDSLLPAGRLREPLSALSRADVVVLPEGLAADHPALRQKSIWRIQRELRLEGAPASPVVFCGVARPEQYFAQVRAGGITPAAEVAFRDHHAYTSRDVQRLLALRGKLAAGGLLTTEKDAINLGELRARLSSLAVSRLEVVLKDGSAALDQILARTAFTRSRSRHPAAANSDTPR